MKRKISGREGDQSPEDPASEEPPPAPRAHLGSDVLTARQPWWCSGSLSAACAGAGAAAAASISRPLSTNGSLLLDGGVACNRAPATSRRALDGRAGSSSPRR